MHNVASGELREKFCARSAVDDNFLGGNGQGPSSGTLTNVGRL